MQATSTVVFIGKRNAGRLQSSTVQQTIVSVPLIQNIINLHIRQQYISLFLFWAEKLAKR